MIAYREEDVSTLNKLAARFCELAGYEVPEGYDFQSAAHPQDQLWFLQAAVALEFFTNGGFQ